MRNILLGFLLLSGFSTYSFAQNATESLYLKNGNHVSFENQRTSQFTEVVYLKNGSIIKGIIIEQIPNVSLKIKTTDGNIFSYAISEVERITKEEIQKTREYDGRTKKTLKGYKGFFETGYIFDVNDDNANKFEVSTSHGYQFNNYLFVGGGIGLNYYTDMEKYSVPVFANLKANFINKKVTPFADVKAGFSVGGVGGFYTSIGLGIRFALKNKTALNVKLEYNYQGYYYDDESDNDHFFNWDFLEHTDLNGIGLKIGFEF